MESQMVCIRLHWGHEYKILYCNFNPLILYSSNFFSETKSDEEENLPSMESLEISKKSFVKQISSNTGGEDDEDIPDMEEFKEYDNIIETDPVS
jgi:hypothetical protein